MEFPPHILQQQLSICRVEDLNAVAAIKIWAPIFIKQLFTLVFGQYHSSGYFPSLQRGRDGFIQVCAREIWLTCAAWDVTLVVGGISGASLLDTTNVLSSWHLGQQYQAQVDIPLSVNIT